MSVTATSEDFVAKQKIVVDNGGGLHFVSEDSQPGIGGYPEDWIPLDDLLDRLDQPVKMLIEGILQKQIDTDEKLRSAFR